MPSRTTVIQRGTREDVKAVFMAIHASAICTDIPEVAAKLKMKRQYVKEIIGVLEEQLKDEEGNPFVQVNTAAGEDNNDTPHDWYQTYYTVDDKTTEQMEEMFDRLIPVPGEDDATDVKAPKAPRTPRSATNPADLPMCRCGCGAPVNNRARNYLPGHDARHAGQVARSIARLRIEEGNLAGTDGKVEALKDSLPTDALRWKAVSMADRLVAKAKGKDGDTVPLSKIVEKVSKDFVKPVKMEVGKVKIGRHFYPAERNDKSGAVTYNKPKDGPVFVATDKIAATFVKEA